MAAGNRAGTLTVLVRDILGVMFLVSAAQLAAQEVFTNETIMSMAKAKLSDKLIVDRIEKNPAKYVVTSSALIALKQQGVSDVVIAAMVAKADSSAPAEQKPTQDTARPEKEPEGQWEIVQSQDEITGAPIFKGQLLYAPAQSNGRTGHFELDSLCSQDGLILKISYFSDFTPNPGYKLTALRPAPKLEIRVAIDGRATEAVSNVPEFTNQAQFLFSPKSSNPGSDFLVAGIRGLSGISVTDISPEEFYRAQSIKLEMPLRNGDLPVLEIRPQDPGFQQFASMCRKAEARSKADVVAPPVDEGQRRERILKTLRVDRHVYEGHPYGPPSTSDSTWNFYAKAIISGDKRLIDYLGGLQPVSHISAVPGSVCSRIYLSGDLLPGQLDWNSNDTQTVYARCHGYGENWNSQATIGQLEIAPSALAELKMRAAALASLGVSTTPAVSEPDPPGQLPAAWMTKRAWFVCPATSIHLADPAKIGQGSIPIVAPTVVTIVSHNEGIFQIRLTSTPDELYETSVASLRETCPPAGTRSPTSVSAVIRTGAATLTVSGQFPGPLTSVHYWILRDKDLTAVLDEAKIHPPRGMAATRAMEALCEADRSACKKITSKLDEHSAAKADGDSFGRAILSTVDPGVYHLIASAAYGSNRVTVLDQQLELKAGPNSATLAGPTSRR